MKKTICIIYPDWFLPFSPTTLNLKNELSKTFEVTIVAFYPFTCSFINDPDIKYFKKKMFLFKVFNKILQYIFKVKLYSDRYAIWQKIHLFFYFLFKRYDHLIAIDLISLWFVKYLKKSNIHLLSLELTANTINYKEKVNINQLVSIIIQSETRLEFLTGNNFKGPVFYIQNSPNFNPDQTHFAPNSNKLIYTGTAIKEFGVLHYLNFLDQFPGYQLFIQGIVHEEEREIIDKKYNHLILQDRLIINSEYLSTADLIDYLSNFRIGFCFYDLSYEAINNFNYLTGPAGKMFTYFAAGVPVIGNNIPGLSPIAQFKAGILIDDLNPSAIINAINEIELNYEFYSANCIKAAQHFDFHANCNKFINYLNTI